MEETQTPSAQAKSSSVVGPDISSIKTLDSYPRLLSIVPSRMVPKRGIRALEKTCSTGDRGSNNKTRWTAFDFILIVSLWNSGKMGDNIGFIPWGSDKVKEIIGRLKTLDVGRVNGYKSLTEKPFEISAYRGER